MNEIEINGIKYQPIEKIEKCPYVITRSYYAGVHAGYMVHKKGEEVILKDCRRLWKWGAFTLSELAENGTTCPEECRFSCINSKIYLNEVKEIIECSGKGKLSIQEVPNDTCK